MTEKREKPKNYTTPKGELSWPKIVRPDEKYDNYQADIICAGDEPGVAQLCSMLDKMAEKVYRQALKDDPKNKAKYRKHVPYEEVLDDNGDETGQIKFKVKINATGKNTKTGETWDNRPIVFAAAGGKPLAWEVLKNLRIWSGTIAKVGFQINPFAKVATGAGVSLRLKAVQIIELADGNGGPDASAYGFESEEGFSVDDYAADASDEDDADDYPADDDTDTETEGAEDEQDSPEANF